ncbi:hypothetical protein N658DRAFT_566230 [Parathielavia hyrcaniae]|uniref:Uncharacterized protein n=1 Tax=Parathielavia hyrcaniae TaxID=113614 RepID=A0AAN6T1W7_9PEZI|nr:hypothetical protein N658DRAFT_566230 [Parathielavia hyrcaniae]
MKLTPIKVKGKGSQRTPWRPPGPPQVAKRKRDDSEESGNHGNEPLRTRFKSKKPAAPIEELPTEILERIILMSRNLNFLRSSLRIGYRFSSTSFLTELLEAAFAPTWESRFGHHLTPRTPHSFIPGDPGFQSALLACQWANTINILEAQQKWYRRHGGGPNRLDEHPEPSKDFPVAPKDPTDVSVSFERDWETFRRDCTHLLSEDRGLTAPCDTDTIQSLKKRAEYLDLHPSVTIPQRLLAGPFDWETARTSFWLLRGGARLFSVHIGSWEWTQRGYDRIMNLQDKELALATLLLLSELKAFEYWPEYLLDQECERIALIKNSFLTARGHWLQRMPR